MATGDKITRNNLPTPQYDSGQWDASGDWDRPQQVWWVSAPVIIAQIQTVGVFLRNPEMWITVYRWNGIGTTTFTQVASGYAASSGAETQTWRWGHNCSESTNASDNGDIHLYRFEVSWDGAGSSTMTLSLRAGSVKSTVNNRSATYSAGKLIKACRPRIWRSGETGGYSSDEAFVSGENPMARQGLRIDWTNANYCYGA